MERGDSLLALVSLLLQGAEEGLDTPKRAPDRGIKAQLGNQGAKLARLETSIEAGQGLHKLGAADDVLKLLLGPISLCGEEGEELLLHLGIVEERGQLLDGQDLGQVSIRLLLGHLDARENVLEMGETKGGGGRRRRGGGGDRVGGCSCGSAGGRGRGLGRSLSRGSGARGR